LTAGGGIIAVQGAVGPLSHLVGRIASGLVLDDPASQLSPLPDLRESIEQAKVEWACARQYFDHVTDPELVDYAIFQLKAAERRYMYLLTMARNEPAASGGLPEAP
jgi:hypothetical protein